MITSNLSSVSKESERTSTLELSVVIPCLNEAATIERCVQKCLRTFCANNIAGEVIVADNGSSDGSPLIAEGAGARVVHVPERGYGVALMGGIASAEGQYIVMADADESYDFAHIPRFLQELRKGFDLVMGNRFKGGIDHNAMPLLHRYVGNPGLTLIGRLFFKAPCNDFYCGIRGFRKDSYNVMGLQSTGMEFATEMVVKATLLKMRITEIPTTLSPDGRGRPPHLRTWRDGWRTLRFFLLYSPRWLFLYPGLLTMFLGGLLGALLLTHPRRLGTVIFDYHSLLYAAMTVVLGFQAVTFAVFTKIFAISEGLLPEDPRLAKVFRYVTLEVGLILGALLIAIGFAGSLYAVRIWEFGHFGPLDPSRTLRVIIPATVSLILGAQVVFASFFVSVLGMRRR